MPPPDVILPSNCFTANYTDGIPVYIEVCLKLGCVLEAASIKTAINVYLEDLEEEYVLNTVLYNSVFPDDINYIRIYSSENIYKVNFHSDKVNKHYYIYEIYHYKPAVQSVYEGNNDVPALIDWFLPNVAFEGLWESLVLEDGLKEQLMSYVQTTLLYSNKQVNPQMVLWNGIVLLHGPPGTGKTSLSKALAQKLSIRLNSKYKTCRLMEINSNNLFSKWFSESSKLISQVFSSIKRWLEIEDQFVCVLMDEVESLVYSRKSGVNDPSDAIRAVNTFLTEIDQLQRYPNFLILATSNLVSVIDSAFADRADLKILVPYPSLWGIYEILKSSIEELINHHLIRGEKNDIFDRMIFKSMLLDNENESDGIVNAIMENSKALFKIAEFCNNLSGRTLRKIPFLTSVKFVSEKTPSIQEFLDVMKDIAKSYDK